MDSLWVSKMEKKMKRNIVYLGIILLAFSFSSCATTNISSFTNSDIKISAYKKILVSVNSRDIDFRKTLELDLVNAFTSNGKNALSSISIISPLKEHTQNELKKIYSENGIDCVLSVSVMDASEESSYIPEQTQTYYRSQYVNGQFASIPYTTTSGGYTVSSSKASFEILLSDVKTGELALKATANSKGDDMKLISKSLAKKIVEEYISQP